jgi:hypothetical protein
LPYASTNSHSWVAMPCHVELDGLLLGQLWRLDLRVDGHIGLPTIVPLVALVLDIVVVE